MGYVVLIIAAVNAVGKAMAAAQAGSAKQRAIDVQDRQQTLMFQQKQIKANDTIKHVADRQLSSATARGYAIDSPTFGALQQDVYRKGGGDVANILLERNIAKANLIAERENVRNSMYAEIFADLTLGGSNASNAISAMPKDKSDSTSSLAGKPGVKG